MATSNSKQPRLPRINGRTCRAWVQERTGFQNSNGQLYGQWEDKGGDARYVVYSYGEHWPLFAYVPRVSTWFENADKYSSTTSKHRSQAHPLCDTVKLDLIPMLTLAREGYSELVTRRLTNG